MSDGGYSGKPRFAYGGPPVDAQNFAAAELAASTAFGTYLLDRSAVIQIDPAHRPDWQVFGATFLLAHYPEHRDDEQGQYAAAHVDEHGPFSDDVHALWWAQQNLPVDPRAHWTVEQRWRREPYEYEDLIA